jgi:hypothetical protein
MKQITLIVLLLLCSSTYAQFLLPKKSDYITVKGDSVTFAKLKALLFDEGFTYTMNDGILVTDAQMKFGPDKYILTARLNDSVIVLRPRIDASIRANAYTTAFAGIATNQIVVTPAVVGFNSSHNKAYEYTLWMAEKLGGDISSAPGKNVIKIYPQRYPK